MYDYEIVHTDCKALMIYSDVWRNLVSIVQFKKHEKHSWRSVTFNKVKACNFTKSNTPP